MNLLKNKILPEEWWKVKNNSLNFQENKCHDIFILIILQNKILQYKK